MYVCMYIYVSYMFAGVHSGDATLVLPAQKLYVQTVRTVKQVSHPTLSLPASLFLYLWCGVVCCVVVLFSDRGADRPGPAHLGTLQHPAAGQGQHGQGESAT